MVSVTCPGLPTLTERRSLSVPLEAPHAGSADQHLPPEATGDSVLTETAGPWVERAGLG